MESTDIDSLLKAQHWNPHSFLGLHPLGKGREGVAVRCLVGKADACEVVDVGTNERWHMQKLTPEGLFEGAIADRREFFRYRLRVSYASGEIREFYDPYSFSPTLSDEDLFLFNEGNDHYIYRKLGGHLRYHEDVPGASFAVWAPSAKRVSVVGNFNHWDGHYHPMRALGGSGVWEIFIPGLEEGTHYKYEIKTQSDEIILKTDPYATYYESPPHNASVLIRVDNRQWNDAEWMENRAKTNWLDKPLSIYEVHLGSWKRKTEDGNRSLSYWEMADKLTEYVLEMGFTHVEFLPLAEHPFTGSWGYQITGFFAPSHRYGKPEEFQHLVDKLHQNGIGVIMDWVPAHFPTDAFALARFDGSAVYEHADPREGFHQDWGTFIPNYGRHEVRCFLIASALAWMDRYHIDGLRVDAVASMLYRDYSREEGEWVPNEYGERENLEAIYFLRTVNDLVHQYYPGTLMIAEESTSFPKVTKPTSDGGLGFDLKWNMGWMHDTLEYFRKDPIHRKHHHHLLTFGMIYQYSEHFTQVFSHDEVVHGKGSLLKRMSADTITDKASTLRALYVVMWAWPGKKTLFMGSEFGQSDEWVYDQQLQWHLLNYLDHSGVQRIVRDLNGLYRGTDLFAWGDTRSEGFEWIAMHDHERSVIAFLRKDNAFEEVYLVVGHYTPVVQHEYRVGVPLRGHWREVLNSDAKIYGGQGEGNFGSVDTNNEPWDSHPYSLALTLPGNSTLIFKYEGEDAPTRPRLTEAE